MLAGGIALGAYEAGARAALGRVGAAPELIDFDRINRAMGAGLQRTARPVLDDPASEGLPCRVIDLFAPEGNRPHTLGASLLRATDLAFGNQTRRPLGGQGRERRLRAVIGRLGETLPHELRRLQGRLRRTEMHDLSYRAGLGKAGVSVRGYLGS